MILVYYHCTSELHHSVQNCLFSLQLIRLKRSYEKLQKKQLKEARQASKSLGEDFEKSEVGILTRKLEVGG